jgi:transformation/transcription domain-associated protein
MEGPSELWRMRKQFALQIASTGFMTYILCLSSRLPSRFHLSRATGQIAMSELLPGVANQAPVFASNDVVPFRFTPNMQNFLGPIFTEGILTSGLMSIGRCLTEPEFELEQQLCLFARDEVMTWLHGRGKAWTLDMSLRVHVAANIDGVVKRAETVACKVERDQVFISHKT